MARTALPTAVAQVEADVRAFARQFPTANVQRAVALCESGRLTWEQVHGLFHKALGAGLAEVQA